MKTNFRKLLYVLICFSTTGGFAEESTRGTPQELQQLDIEGSAGSKLILQIQQVTPKSDSQLSLVVKKDGKKTELFPVGTIKQVKKINLKTPFRLNDGPPGSLKRVEFSEIISADSTVGYSLTTTDSPLIFGLIQSEKSENNGQFRYGTKLTYFVVRAKGSTTSIAKLNSQTLESVDQATQTQKTMSHLERGLKNKFSVGRLWKTEAHYSEGFGAPEAEDDAVSAQDLSIGKSGIVGQPVKQVWMVQLMTDMQDRERLYDRLVNRPNPCYEVLPRQPQVLVVNNSSYSASGNEAVGYGWSLATFVSTEEEAHQLQIHALSCFPSAKKLLVGLPKRLK